MSGCLNVAAFDDAIMIMRRVELYILYIARSRFGDKA